MTLPVVGVSRPTIMRMSVVLPHPDGPRRTVTVPSSKTVETSFTAPKSPKYFEMPSMRTSAMLHSLAYAGSTHRVEQDK